MSGFVEITDIDEFQAINVDTEGDYMVVNNIDGSATSAWNNGEGFEALSTFKGDLYGGGYEISGIYINRPSDNLQAPFRGTSACFIGDLHMVNVDITGRASCGGFLGSCSIIGTQVHGCSASGNVASIHDGWNDGSVSGGFVGKMNSGSIQRCSSSVDVSGDGQRIGGFVGHGSGGIAYDCYATGTVTLTEDVNFSMIAGFAGHIGDTTVIRSYSTGLVTVPSGVDNDDIGGFSGRGSSTDCFFDEETTGQNSDGRSGTAAPKTTQEMYDIDTYTDETSPDLDDAWDIAKVLVWDQEIWSIDDGSDYPKLKGTSVRVPDVIGKQASTARSDIKSARLFVGDEHEQQEEGVPDNEVFDQEPDGGIWVVAGSKVDIWISVVVVGVYVNIAGQAVECSVYVNVAGVATLADVDVRN